MPGALHGIGDDDDGDDDDGGSNNWAHCDKSVEAAGGGGGGGRSGGGRGVLQFASLCIYLQLPDGAQQKERVLFFPPSSPLPPLGPGFWTMFQVPYAACELWVGWGRVRKSKNQGVSWAPFTRRWLF